MQLGETIATYDVALALRGETGKFEVTSPAGETYHVTCKPNHSISSFEWSGNRPDAQPFLIRKVAGPVSPEQGKETAAGAVDGTVPPQSARAPFLVENQEDEGKPSPQKVSAIIASTPIDNLQQREGADLDLLYLESDPRTQRPSACVYLKGGQRDHAILTEILMTSTCTTYNELDAEIRRLHAQLDEIRSLAKKNFYKAQMVAASA